ncbi:MAG: hypothetical protein NTW14_08840 [bacterium]|nr:hypothetical protein [bacterium]
MKINPMKITDKTTVDKAKFAKSKLIAPLAFISIALLFCQVGYLLPGVSRALGGLLWLVTVYLAADKKRWFWVILSAVLIFNPYGAAHRTEGLWLLGLLPWAGGIWGRRWMGAALLAALGGWIWSNFPGWWVPLDEFTAASARGLTSVNLSAPAAGLPLLGLAICFPLAAVIFERHIFAPMAAVLASLAALLLFWWLQAPLDSGLRSLGFRGLHDAVHLQWFLLLLLAVVTFLWGIFHPPQIESRFGKRSWLTPALCLMGAFLIARPPVAEKAEMTKEIVFYNQGYLNWDLPKYGFYGKHAGGMFGLAPELLRWRGFQVSMTDTIDNSVLDRAGVLVFINLKDPLSAGELTALHRFVTAGGSILLLGDHTGLGDIRDPSNGLLKPYGIELNFDTAKPYRNGWAGSMVTVEHPITAWLGQERHGGGSAGETQIWVGASLQVFPPAYPVIVGRDGFSDIGNPANAKDGYLGDFMYRANERLGNMVLVAESRAGRGKVLVFGDTSTLQNGALVRSGDFVDRMFLYLLSPVEHPGSHWKWLGVLSLLAGLVLWFRRKPTNLSLTLAVVALFVGASFAEMQVRRQLDHSSRNWTANAWPRALIDHSHTPRSPINQTSIDGHWGLQNCLMRSGLLPQTLESWDSGKLKDARVLIEIAPAEKFSKSEKREIAEFMTKGGLVVLCCGMEEFDGSRTLLKDYGLEPIYVPLGPAEISAAVQLPGESDSISVDNAKELTVHFHKAWETKVTNPKAETVLTAYDKPLVSFVRVGEGGLLYLPDTDFMVNLNLESPIADPFEDNILYLRYLLRTYAGGK